MTSIKTSRPKIFKCPVHGYIAIPRQLVKSFIDNPIFQRLRHIEQTSMRPLYPSAHHNRFVHSLGVYHLACLAFENLLHNTSDEILAKVDLKKYRWPFCIAGLMHDCGHAPFSHSFENYYQRNNRALDLLQSQVNDDNFENDYKFKEQHGQGPSPHEIFSAALFLKNYQGILCDLDLEVNPSLIARMITGVVHRSIDHGDENKKVENCLIMLINGSAIDLDKLDYIIRDTWASGVCNVSIDVPRLLSALLLEYYDGRLLPCYNKSAISVLQSVVSGRNYLFRWTYTHHTVCYYEDLLRRAGEQLFNIISPNDDSFIDTVFSAEVFERPIESCGITVYLPTDGDLLYLMKQKCDSDQISEVKEIISRTPSHIPLWKSSAEFEYIFEKKPDPNQRDDIRDRIKAILEPVLEDEELLNELIVLRAKAKVVEIDENDIYVSIRGNVMPFVKAVPDAKQDFRNIKSGFYYVFISDRCIDKKNDCIDAIRSAVSNI